MQHHNPDSHKLTPTVGKICELIPKPKMCKNTYCTHIYETFNFFDHQNFTADIMLHHMPFQILFKSEKVHLSALSEMPTVKAA